MPIKYSDIESVDDTKGIKTLWITYLVKKFPENSEFLAKYIPIVADTYISGFKLRKYQTDVLKDFSLNSGNLVYASRQTGTSTIMRIFILFYAMFNPDKTIFIMNDNLQQSSHMMGDIQKLYENLPDNLKLGVETYSRSQIQFTNGSNINTCRASINYLRGSTVSLLYIENADNITKDIQSHIDNINMITNYCKNNVIISGKPNNKDNLFYKLWEKSLSGSNAFKRIIHNWHIVPGFSENWKNDYILNYGLNNFNRQFECKFEDIK